MISTEKYICCGLQDFIPESSKYDLIWCQWVLGHLTDDDLVSFFKRCKSALKPNGLICFKENVSTSSEFDAKDSSYTRSRQHYLDLVTLAGESMCLRECLNFSISLISTFSLKNRFFIFRFRGGKRNQTKILPYRLVSSSHVCLVMTSYHKR